MKTDSNFDVGSSYYVLVDVSVVFATGGVRSMQFRMEIPRADADALTSTGRSATFALQNAAASSTTISTGAIVGIVIGAVAAAAIIALLIAFTVRRRRQHARDELQASNMIAAAEQPPADAMPSLDILDI